MSVTTTNAIRGGELNEEHELQVEEYDKEFKEIGKHLQAPWKERTWGAINFSNSKIRLTYFSCIKVTFGSN